MVKAVHQTRKNTCEPDKRVSSLSISSEVPKSKVLLSYRTRFCRTFQAFSFNGESSLVISAYESILDKSAYIQICEHFEGASYCSELIQRFLLARNFDGGRPGGKGEWGSSMGNSRFCSWESSHMALIIRI